MMIIFLYCNQGLLFEFLFWHVGEYFQSTRILIKHWRYLQKNKQRTTIESESENPQTGVQQSKLLILAFSAINVKPLASRQASLTSTKCKDVWNKNLDVDEISPLPPQLLHPPGLHLPGCSPPLQLPGLGRFQAGYLHPGHKNACQPIDKPNAKCQFLRKCALFNWKTIIHG